MEVRATMQQPGVLFADAHNLVCVKDESLGPEETQITTSLVARRCSSYANVGAMGFINGAVWEGSDPGIWYLGIIMKKKSSTFVVSVVTSCSDDDVLAIKYDDPVSLESRFFVPVHKKK